MPGTYYPPPQVSDPNMHHDMCVTHVPWCMTGSLTNGFLWSRWRGKCSRHSRCMRKQQYYGSGKKPIGGRAAYPAPHGQSYFHQARIRKQSTKIENARGMSHVGIRGTNVKMLFDNVQFTSYTSLEDLRESTGARFSISSSGLNSLIGLRFYLSMFILANRWQPKHVSVENKN